MIKYLICNSSGPFQFTTFLIFLVKGEKKGEKGTKEDKRNGVEKATTNSFLLEIRFGQWAFIFREPQNCRRWII